MTSTGSYHARRAWIAERWLQRSLARSVKGPFPHEPPPLPPAPPPPLRPPRAGAERHARRADALPAKRRQPYWPEKINVPILILHGTANWRTNPKDQALALAEKLKALGKTCELVMYAQDSHGLPFHWRERDQRIVEWFRRYMR
jgi:pimeloyl-ACP methyl ester carboxylesterase